MCVTRSAWERLSSGYCLLRLPLVVLPGIATTTPSGTTVTYFSSSHLEHEVVVGSVGITLGRAVLHPDERVTLFYVAKDTAEELDGAVMIDNAEIESSDGQQYSRSRPEGPWKVTPTAFSVSQMATVDSVRNARVVDGLVDSVVVGEETLPRRPGHQGLGQRGLASQGGKALE